MNIRRTMISGAAAALALAAGGAVAGQFPASATASAGPSLTAAARVTLSARTGPPTSMVKVSGTGFGAHRAVDIFLDTKDEALAATNGHGAFSGIKIRVPASALPGTHYITAVQRHSGRSAQARFLVNTNWAQFGRSATHTAVNPYENVLSPANASEIGQRWRFTAGDSVNGSPAVANGVVYVTSFDRNVYALNAATGAKLWSDAIGGSASSPAVANGVVYVATGNKVYALNAATGAKLWRFITRSRTDSSPAVANGVVYIGYTDGEVVALNAATGAKRWSFTTGGFVRSSPAVANGVVYVGSADDNVYALNAATGAELWSYTTGDFVFSSPAVANGVVYVGSDDGNVYALNAALGVRLWSFTTGEFVAASPAVANGVVYIGSADGNVYALNAATGAKLWSDTIGDTVLASPAVANGVVYIAPLDVSMYALNAATGARLWRFTAGSFASSPAVANGVVYFGNDDHNVYAFGLPSQAAAIKRPNPGQLRPNHALRPQQGKGAH